MSTLLAAFKWTTSKLQTLQRCGEQFRRRYLDEDYRPSSPQALRGTIVHRITGRALGVKLRDGTLPSVEWARDTAATEFGMEWERSGVLIRPKDLRVHGSPDGVKAAAKDFAVELAAFHIATVAPSIVPVAVERKITVRPQDSDIEILATLDLIARPARTLTDATPFEVIRDLKTSEKAPNRQAAHQSQQLTMQAMVRWADCGTLPRDVALDYLVRTPALKQRKLYPLTSTRDMDDARVLVRRINLAVDAVQRGVFVPANPDGPGSPCSWCDYRDECPYVRRRGLAPVEEDDAE